MPAIMTPAGALDLATVLLGNRIIFIGQYINSQVAQRVISQLVTLAAVDEESDILVSVYFCVFQIITVTLLFTAAALDCLTSLPWLAPLAHRCVALYLITPFV